MRQIYGYDPRYVNVQLGEKEMVMYNNRNQERIKNAVKHNATLDLLNFGYQYRA